MGVGACVGVDVGLDVVVGVGVSVGVDVGVVVGEGVGVDVGIGVALGVALAGVFFLPRPPLWLTSSHDAGILSSTGGLVGSESQTLLTSSSDNTQ